MPRLATESQRSVIVIDSQQGVPGPGAQRDMLAKAERAALRALVTDARANVAQATAALEAAQMPRQHSAVGLLAPVGRAETAPLRLDGRPLTFLRESRTTRRVSPQSGAVVSPSRPQKGEGKRGEKRGREKGRALKNFRLQASWTAFFRAKVTSVGPAPKPAPGPRRRVDSRPRGRSGRAQQKKTFSLPMFPTPAPRPPSRSCPTGSRSRPASASHESSP